jgi:hypothetical protein
VNQSISNQSKIHKMGIEAREQQTPETTANVRPLSERIVVTEVTPGMILQDLAMGIDRKGIAEKYAYEDAAGNLQPFEDWMVTEMFKDPLLKNKRPATVKRLPFKFATTDPEAGILDISSDPMRVKPVTQTSTSVNAAEEVKVEQTTLTGDAASDAVLDFVTGQSESNDINID